MTFKKIFLASALVATVSSVAAAQTDFGSPMGAGAGLGASTAPRGIPNLQFSPARALFFQVIADVQIANPAGGVVTVPMPAAQALGAALMGNGSATTAETLTQALGGGPNANSAVNAFIAWAGNQTFPSLVSAVQAYNTYVTGNNSPPPAALAIRLILADAMGVR